MAADSVQGTRNNPGAQQDVRKDELKTTADVIGSLIAFDGPPEQYLRYLLNVQCQLAAAKGGAVFRPGQQGNLEIVAVHPPAAPRELPPWVGHALELAPQTMESGQSALVPMQSSGSMYGQPAQEYLLLVPLRQGGPVAGLEAFYLPGREPAAMQLAQERVELSAGFLSVYGLQLQAKRRTAALRRMQSSIEAQAAIQAQRKFQGAAMTLCNELVAAWDCERVSLGLHEGRYVKIKAMSHTEKFSRKMQVVQDLEGAMEECLDQDSEIVLPEPGNANVVTRATRLIAQRYGPSSVLSLPLRRDGEVVGVVTLERDAENPFGLEEVETLRLTCDLLAGRLDDLHQRDRWFGARAARKTRDVAAVVVGPKHTWIKLAVIAVLAGLFVLIFGKGTQKVESEFAFQTEQRRHLTAPYESYLDEVFVEIGDHVEKGDVLATLKDFNIRQELAEARPELQGVLIQASQARKEGKLAEEEAALARAESIRARIELLEYRLQQARITAPIEGVVTVGDLKRQQGTAVKPTDQLFEIAPLQSLRAELQVTEDEIVYVEVGQEGELATSAYPNQKIKFVVESIDPVAKPEEQKNVFRVKASLQERPDWLRPGMKGQARIYLQERSYGWLLTHKLVDWIRMKFWL